MLLLAPFASKLVNDSSHIESLKTLWKSTFRRFKIKAIVEFSQTFKFIFGGKSLTKQVEV